MSHQTKTINLSNFSHNQFFSIGPNQNNITTDFLFTSILNNYYIYYLPQSINNNGDSILNKQTTIIYEYGQLTKTLTQKQIISNFKIELLNRFFTFKH